MPNPIAAIAGAQIVTSVMSNREQRKAAGAASEAQIAAGGEAIGEQRAQYERMQELLSPYIEAGQKSIEEQQALLGIDGDQQAAYTAIESSPAYQAMIRQGEEGILSNAAATGGIRGGNVQASLAQFRPSLLNQFITQRYERLGGIAGRGQAAAGGLASEGAQTSRSISDILISGGEQQAAEALARGQANVNVWGDVAGAFGTAYGSFEKLPEQQVRRS